MACDQCGAVLLLNDRGDSDTGEEAAWVEIRTTFGRYDLCTRACAIELLESDEFIEAMDAGVEAIAEIANHIRDAHEE